LNNTSIIVLFIIEYFSIVRGDLALCPTQKHVFQRKNEIFVGGAPWPKLSGELFPSRTSLFPLCKAADPINMRQENSSFHEILMSKLGSKPSPPTFSQSPSFNDETPTWIFAIPETPKRTWSGPSQFTSYKKTQMPRAQKAKDPLYQKIIFEKQFRAVDFKDQALQSFLFLEAHGNLAPVFTLKELKSCFRKLAKNHHPDKNVSQSHLYLQIREAYEKLLHSIKDLDSNC
jgi:hypothetical protein